MGTHSPDTKPKCLSIIDSIVGERPILELTMHVVDDIVWQTLDSLHQMRSRTTFTPPPVTARALPDLDKDVSEHHATSYFLHAFPYFSSYFPPTPPHTTFVSHTFLIFSSYFS